MPLPLLFLALPSLCVFLLLVWHADRNLGHRRALIYFGALCGYGWIRANWLQHISRTDLKSAFPYLINLPVLNVGGASLQEIIGWGVAVTLSWLISDRILQRLGISPGPHRTAALAAFVMCAVCLAVETAAIESGWWQWTLNQQVRGLFGRVPLVGLLDWGFVAFDFLLPYLVLAVPAPWPQRIPALCLFFLHFRFHSELRTLPEPLLLTPNDLMHAAIFAYVLVVAAGEKNISALPPIEKERSRWISPVSAFIVALAVSLSSVIAAGYPRGILAAMPLATFAAAAYFLPLRVAEKAKEKPRQGKGKPAAPPEPSWSLFLVRIGIPVVVFVVVCAVRVPFNRRTAEFITYVNAASALMNNQDWSGAEVEAGKAIQARPENPGGYMLLGQILLNQKKDGEARQALEKALSINPTHQSALSLMSTLEIRARRLDQAATFAATGRRVYPDQVEFRYLAALAAGGGPAPALSPAVRDVLQSIGPAQRNQLQALFLVAMNLEDVATLRELQRILKPEM